VALVVLGRRPVEGGIKIGRALLQKVPWTMISGRT
jgi:hypothetical protein